RRPVALAGRVTEKFAFCSAVHRSTGAARLLLAMTLRTASAERTPGCCVQLHPVHSARPWPSRTTPSQPFPPPATRVRGTARKRRPSSGGRFAGGLRGCARTRSEPGSADALPHSFQELAHDLPLSTFRVRRRGHRARPLCRLP